MERGTSNKPRDSKYRVNRVRLPTAGLALTDNARGTSSDAQSKLRMLINRGRGYKNTRYLLLKAKRMAVTNTEFIAVHRVKEAS